VEERNPETYRKRGEKVAQNVMVCSNFASPSKGSYSTVPLLGEKRWEKEEEEVRNLLYSVKKSATHRIEGTSVGESSDSIAARNVPVWRGQVPG